jgi:hypothetical protein
MDEKKHKNKAVQQVRDSLANTKSRLDKLIAELNQEPRRSKQA